MVSGIQSLESLIGTIVGVVTIVIIASKKLSDLKIGAERTFHKESLELLSIIQQEKNEAIRRHEECIKEKTEIFEEKALLETELIETRRQLSKIKNRMSLLSHINEKLQKALNEFQAESRRQRGETVVDAGLFVPTPEGISEVPSVLVPPLKLTDKIEDTMIE